MHMDGGNRRAMRNNHEKNEWNYRNKNNSLCAAMVLLRLWGTHRMRKERFIVVRTIEMVSQRGATAPIRLSHFHFEMDFGLWGFLKERSRCPRFKSLHLIDWMQLPNEKSIGFLPSDVHHRGH